MSEGGFSTGEGVAPDVGQDFRIETGGETNETTEASTGWLARNKDAVARNLYKGGTAVLTGVSAYFAGVLMSGDYRIGGAVAATIGGWKMGGKMLEWFGEDQKNVEDSQSEMTEHEE